MKINLIHIYSYLGYSKLLLEALELGGEVKIDDDLRSPLYYALVRGCQDCVDVLLRHIADIKHKRKRFLNYCNALRYDFELLLTNRSANLPEFLEAIFYSVKNVIDFAVPLSTLPILHFESNKIVNPYNYVHQHEQKSFGVEVHIEFKTLPFMISYKNGSIGSINLLKKILESPNTRVLKTEFVKTYVRNKWDQLWVFILLLTLISWSNIILMVALLCYSGPDTSATAPPNYSTMPIMFIPLTASFLGVNSLMFLYEMIQSFTTGFNYFTEISNLIDITRLGLCFTWAIFSYFYTQQDLYILAWFMILLNFYRGFSGFRAFDMTRYYTALIKRVIWEVIPFIIIFFYTTLAFGASYTASQKFNEVTLFKMWQTSYEQNLGEFTNQQDLFEYGYFMLASVFNVIIILNLLISILGDAFSTFQAESDEIDVLDMIDFIIEIETLMHWRRGENQKRYIQKCQQIEADEIDTIEGKVKVVYNEIKMVKQDINLIKRQNEEILKGLKDLAAK